MEEKNIWVIGGDRRQTALARQLAEDGHTVYTYGLEKEEGMFCQESLKELFRADCVILPLPAQWEDGGVNAPLALRQVDVEEILNEMRSGQLLCAGMVGEGLKYMAEERGLLLRDYFAREELAVLNAIPTAEGAVQIAMEELPITIHGARVLILGCGRIGRLLIPMLRGLGARVTVGARKPEQRAAARAAGAESETLAGLGRWLCAYDLVINTVPARLLGREELKSMKEGAVIIDLASHPGGTDFTAAEELGVRCLWARALPGRVAPVTAGRYIADTVYHIMEELGV